MLRKESELKSYQHTAVDWILDNKQCGLNLDMGLGKTISSLTAFVKIHNVYVKKLLVIAPLNVANSTWHEEILNWEHTKHLKYVICCGDERQRKKALDSDADVYIINQEVIPWMLVNGYSKYGMIIVDESSGFKSCSSKRFKALRKFTSVYMVLLTGTPIPDGLIDIWSQQYLIDKGELLEKNITSYITKYFRKDFSGFKFICNNPEEICKLLSKSWLRMKASDYLLLPKKSSIRVNVDIDNYEQYKKYESEYFLRVNGNELTAVNAGVLANKLLQYCNGAVYNEEGDYVIIHNNKLDMLKKIIKAHCDENILIAFNFKSDECRIKDAIPNAITINSKNSEEVKKDWNDGKIKTMLCQCGSAKGLNLQKGGRIIIWFGLTWNLEHYLQFNARLHRQGQDKPVIIYHLVASKCKDEKLLKMLNNKNTTQEMLFKILKEKN